MEIYNQIVARILKEQELLMGPVAWFQAEKVSGLMADRNAGTVSIEERADAHVVIDSLVERFTNLFGRAGHEVCIEAVSAIIADMKPEEVPSSLQGRIAALAA